MKILKTVEQKLNFRYIVGIIVAVLIFGYILKNKAERDSENIGGYKVQISNYESKISTLDSLKGVLESDNILILDSLKITKRKLDSLENLKGFVNNDYEKKHEKIENTNANDLAVDILNTIDGLK